MSFAIHITQTKSAFKMPSCIAILKAFPSLQLGVFSEET